MITFEHLHSQTQQGKWLNMHPKTLGCISASVIRDLVKIDGNMNEVMSDSDPSCYKVSDWQ